MRFGARPWLVLALLISMHITVNYSIVTKSLLLRKNADAFQINEALQYSRTITDQKAGGFFRAVWDAAKTELHPHLYTFSLGTIMSLAPPANHKDLDLPLLCLNSVFLLILIFSVYGIGNLLFGSREGLLAAALLSLSPAIFGPIRLALIEVPLSSLVCLTVFLLLKSSQFSLRSMSLLAGVTFGLAQLTKETAVIFILPAAFFLFLRPANHPEAGKKQRTQNLLIFLAAGIIISAPVFLNPVNKALYSCIWSSFIVTKTSGLLPSSPLLYLKAFPQFYLGIVAFLFTLPLLASYAINIRARNAVLTIWFIIPLLVCALCGLKEVRYLIPAIPALFLILSAETFTPFFRKRIIIYPVLLVSVFALQFCLINLAVPELPGYEAYNDHNCGLLSVHRDKDIFRAEKLVDLVLREPRPKNKLRVIGFPTLPPLEKMNYLFTLKGTDVEFIQILTPKKEPAMDKLCGACSSAEYFLDLDAGPDKTMSLNKQLPADYQKYKAVCLPFFELAGEFHMRNNNVINVYKKIAEGNE